MVSKMTVAQIKQGVKAGVINTSAKVKRTAEGKFISLAQCPEFDSVMTGTHDQGQGGCACR